MFESARATKTQTTGIVVDASDWPLILVTYHSTVSDDEFVRFVAEMDELRYRREPYVAIHDGRILTGLSSAQRQLYVASLERDEHLLKKYHKATACLCPSPLVRGLLTAVQWVYTPPFPVRVFDRMAPARRWVLSRLEPALTDTPARQRTAPGQAD